MSRRSPVVELLDRAEAARLTGRTAEAARLYDEAIDNCRAADDLAGWTQAVLGAASVYVFGTDPGKLPAQLHDVLVRTSDDADRARLAAALARCWVYAGHAARARQFAAEAVRRAERAGVPELLADCLDAALATRWGPDELPERVALARRLEEAAAHVLDADRRLQAHLWGLQVACEALDVQAVHRHMRALERLGEESQRALFFAASRRVMLDLLRGRTDTAGHLIGVARDASAHAGLADGWMVVEALTGYTAVQAGDRATCARIAAECEEFALGEGATAVCAEAAYFWLGAGQPERVRRLVHTFHGPVLGELPRDVNWLLTLQCLFEAALAVDDRDIIEQAYRLLAPYSGRAVFNAGAVMFHGLTDDTLARGAAMLGDGETAERLRARALTTYERLGACWWRDRLRDWSPPVAESVAAPACPVRLHPSTDGLWLIGRDGAAVTMRALRGYTYLRYLLRHPGASVSALDLVTDGSGGVVQPGAGELLDRRARQEYRRRLRDIDHELAEAEGWSDLGRAEALRAEREALLHELAAATGLGGRPRATGASAERARIAATKAISAAIHRIAGVDRSLGSYLHTTVHTGTRCSYTPPEDHELHWILDP